MIELMTNYNSMLLDISI